MMRLAATLLAAGLSAQAQPAGAGAAPATVEPVRRPLSFTLARDAPYEPLTGRERRRLLLRTALLDPWDPPRATLAAAISQWQHAPEGWPLGSTGFGWRVGDNFARFALQDTIEMAGGAALRHEVRYIPSKSRSMPKRALHALVANLRTYNEEGQWRPHYSRITSAVVSNWVAHTWRPPEDMTTGNVLGGAVFQLMFGVAGNMAREFRPEISRVFRWMRPGPPSPALGASGGLPRHP
jgi:hypothetical protein